MMLPSTKENLARVSAVFSYFSGFPHELVIRGHKYNYIMQYVEHIAPSGDDADVPRCDNCPDLKYLVRDVKKNATTIVNENGEWVATSSAKIGKLFNEMNIDWVNLNTGDYSCPDHSNMIECLHTNYPYCAMHLRKLCARKIAEYQFRWLIAVSEEENISDCLERFQELNRKKMEASPASPPDA
jgi:hypothetical protein